MSPAQSVPYIYHWPRAWVLLPFVPALVVLPFLLLGQNRRLQAWLIVIPYSLIAAVAMIAQALNLLRRIPAVRGVLVTPNLSDLYAMMVALASGICVLCLTAYAVPSWSSRTKFLVLPVLFLAPILFVYACVQENPFQEWIPLLRNSGFALALFVILIVAGRSCRKRWKLSRCALLFTFWSLLLILAMAMYSWGRMLNWRLSVLLRYWHPLLTSFASAVLLLLGFVFIVVFPFLIMAFKNPLYKQRMMAAFRVPNDLTNF